MVLAMSWSRGLRSVFGKDGMRIVWDGEGPREFRGLRLDFAAKGAFLATCGYKPSERNDGEVDVCNYSISRSTSYLVPTSGILSVLESSHITTEDLLWRRKGKVA